MALRVKTIEYAFQSRNTSLATATRYDFAAITLYIPENSNRTFRSVRIQVSCRGNNTSAASLTSPVVGIKLGAVAFSDTTLGNPAGNSGENESFWFERDVTSYFNTNFGAGASQTCQVGIQFTGLTTINHGAKLIITYEADEQQTRVKTVRIPLDSGLGALTATLAEIGTNQIPNLSTFLPESSKTIREVWFELWYNEATLGTTNDASLGMQVNSETEHLTGVHESGNASSCFGRYIWEQTTATWVTSGAVAAFKLRSSTITTASTFNHVGIVLCITYEYDHTNSTTILNSLVLGLEDLRHTAGNTSADEIAAIAFDIDIQEPATVALVQSGALILFSQNAAVDFSVKFGAGSYRTYDETSDFLFCGGSTLTHRIDSGGAGGVAFTIARGRNKVYYYIYVSAVGTRPNGFTGFMFLNYTSGKHANGDGVHNHSCAWNAQDSQANSSSGAMSSVQRVYIPATNWFLNDIMFVSTTIINSVSGVIVVLYAESAAGELSGGGYDELDTANLLGENENGVHTLILAGAYIRSRWDRFYNDPDTTRLDIEAARRLFHMANANSQRNWFYWTTHHEIYYSVSGSISGSNGGTVAIKAIRDVDGAREELASTSRVGDGAFSMTVYTNVDNIYCEAREDATHVGRSERSTAS